MFRARLIASLLVSLAAGACSASSSSSSDPAGIAGGGPSMPEVGCAQASADLYTPGMQKPGAAGRYSFTLLSSSPAPPAIDDNTFVLQVLNADGQPVAGELSVALDMPEHGHPSPTQPNISFDPDNAAFTLQPMNLFMVGLWRLTFSFQSDSGRVDDADSAVFKFCVD